MFHEKFEKQFNWNFKVKIHFEFKAELVFHEIF